MHVLVLATYPTETAPGQRFRFEQYFEPLAHRGIHLHLSSLMNRRTANALHRPGNTPQKVGYVMRGLVRRLRDTLRARRYDVVLIQREAYPLGPAFIESILTSLKVPYVFDFDDAVYLPNVSHANRFVAPLKFPGRVASVVRRAAIVAAGNEELAEWARQHNERVELIPSTIDTDVYVPRRKSSAQGRLCIGWSGSLTTTQHLETIAGVLREIQAESGVRLVVIGDEQFSIPGAHVEARPWVHNSEVRDLLELDVGLMPLPDNAWARGKCGLKALQYMALGIPTVMSPVGVNRRIARDGAALLAQDPDDWRTALRALLRDARLRDRLASAGRARVESEYSMHTNLPRWISLLERARTDSGDTA